MYKPTLSQFSSLIIRKKGKVLKYIKTYNKTKTKYASGSSYSTDQTCEMQKSIIEQLEIITIIIIKKLIFKKKKND